MLLSAARIESPYMESAVWITCACVVWVGWPIGGGRGPAGGPGGAPEGDAAATAGEQQGGCGAASRGREQGRV